MTDLSQYKKDKKLKLIYQELMAANSIINDSITKLTRYNKYIPVNESISMLTNSRTLIEIHLHKYKKELEK